jgi:gliding motility-associated-like protein
MRLNVLKNIVLLLFCFLAYNSLSAQGTTCATADPFCSNGLDPYPAGVNNPAAPAGNNYDCLFTQPNPAWFYISVSQNGDLSFTLDNTNSVDIDFIVYGPFTDLAAATSQCGGLGNGGASGAIADCSYSGAAVEQVDIIGAQAGEVYLLMVTNFSNQPTDIFASPNAGSGDYACDCETTVWFDEAPVGFNDGVLVDTTEYSAEFVVCAGSQLGFTIDVQADSIVDSVGVYLPNTDIGDVFGASNVTVFGPTYPITNQFDTANFVILINTDSTHVGVNNFVFSILNSNCVQDLNIQVTVVGVNAVADDTTICAGIAQDVQLNASAFAPSGGDLQWTQLSGPVVTISDDTIPDPIISVPAGTTAGDSIVMQVEFSSTPDTILGTPCISRGYVTVYLVDDPISLATTASEYLLCQNGLDNAIQLNSIASGAGIDSINGQWNWTTVPALYTGSMTDTTIADPIGNFAGGPGDSILLYVSYNYGACAGTDTLQLDFGDWEADVTPAVDTFCPGDVITLTATPAASSCAPVYTVSSIAFAPLAGSGTAVSLGDDALSSALPIGFSFEFFCNSYTNFYISSNGFVTFDATAGNGCCSGDPLPDPFDPNNLIALAWEDLDPDGAGTIEYFVVGTAPSRILVVNFIAVPHWPGPGPNDDVTVQMLLYETSNIIEIHTTTQPDAVGSHSQGIENSDGTVGFPVPGRSSAAWTATNDAWRFVPSTSFNPTYAWSPNVNITSTTTAVTDVTPQISTNYIVTVTESGCSMIDSTILVESTALPAPTISCDSSNSTSVSFGWNTISGAANYEYSLDGGTTWVTTTDTFFTATGLVSGDSATILVRGLAASGGCLTGASASQTCVTTNCNFPAPVVTCDSTSFTSVAFSWNGLAGADQGYEYSIDGGATWISTNDTFAIITGLANGTTINIQVQGISSNANCTPSQLGGASCTSQTCNNPQGNVLNSPNTLCTGSDAFVVVNGLSGGTLPFLVDLGNGQVDTAFAIGDTLFQGIAVGNYNATLTDLSNGCVGQGSIAVIITDNAQPVDINISQTATIACGSNSGAALAANTVSGNPISYNWSDGQSTATASALAAGTYAVTATDATGTCSDTASFTVTGPFTPNLDAYIDVVGQDSTCITVGESIDLNAGANEAGVSYEWSPALYLDDANVFETTATPDSTGTIVYTITATSLDSCVTTDQVILCVDGVGFMGMPTAFTPNGDNVNDTFGPVELQGATVTRFEIYNRWGVKIFEDNVNYQWNGQVGGQDQPRDTYIYVLEYQFPGDEEPTLLRGSVTLLR